MMVTRLLLSITAGAALALTSGCFSVRQLDIKAGLAEVRAEGEAPELTEAPAPSESGVIPQAIQVSVVSPPSLGGYCAETTTGVDEGRGFLVCRGQPLTDGDEVGQIERMASGRSNVGIGYQFSGFGTVVSETLAEHLKDRFADVRVELVDQPPVAGTTVVAKLDLYAHFMRTGDKRAFVTLEATGMSTPGISVQEDATRAIGHAHLLWMVPAGALTFPVGFAIGQYIFASVEDAMVQESIADAIDRATHALAAEIAKRVAQSASAAEGHPAATRVGGAT